MPGKNRCKPCQPAAVEMIWNKRSDWKLLLSCLCSLVPISDHGVAASGIFICRFYQYLIRGINAILTGRFSSAVGTAADVSKVISDVAV